MGRLVWIYAGLICQKIVFICSDDAQACYPRLHLEIGLVLVRLLSIYTHGIIGRPFSELKKKRDTGITFYRNKYTKKGTAELEPTGLHTPHDSPHCQAELDFSRSQKGQ